jgi:hypothetical protein
VDYRFTLLLENGEFIVIDEPFTLTTDGHAQLVPPGEAVYDVAAALPLFNESVVTVTAAGSGELRVVFADGATIDVPTNRGYENWQLTLPDGREWIGLPGGGVSFRPAPV